MINMPNETKGEYQSFKSDISWQTEFLQRLLNQSSKSVSDAIRQVILGYHASFFMYIILFSTGIFLLVFALIYTITGGYFTSLATGIVGTVEVVYTLSGKTTDKLQNSRADLIQLQTAFYAWINEVYHWNLLLDASQLFKSDSSTESENTAFHQKMDDFKKVSDHYRECTETMLIQINDYATGSKGRGDLHVQQDKKAQEQ